MIGIFAEMENNMRVERQKISIRRALENGARFGRKLIMSHNKFKSIKEVYLIIAII